MITTVYYEAEGQSAVEVHDSRYEVNLRTTEQAWGPRFQTVGEEWTMLDLGYLEGKPVCELTVENLEGTSYRVIPSQEERDEVAKRAVELTCSVLIRPGRSCRFEPVGKVMVRCRHGRARLKVAAVPGD